jgi:hypothetical protein
MCEGQTQQQAFRLPGSSGVRTSMFPVTCGATRLGRSTRTRTFPRAPWKSAAIVAPPSPMAVMSPLDDRVANRRVVSAPCGRRRVDWNRPTESQPNHWQTWDANTPARMAVQTLKDAFRIESPTALTIERKLRLMAAGLVQDQRYDCAHM